MMTNWVADQITLNKMYMSMVNSVLESDSFYFSTSYDISHCLQRLHNASPDFTSLALHERVNYKDRPILHFMLKICIMIY